MISLAISSYAKVKTLADGPGLLNLAWTLDERAQLSTDINAVIARELESEARDGLEFVNSYLVKDPYGEGVLGPGIAEYFARPQHPGTVTCAAGAVSVLHALARFPDGRPACAIGRSYIDFPCWATHAGRACIALDPAADVMELARQAASSRASLLVLERPRLLGEALADLGEVAELCALAARSGMLVLIDESHANYHPPAYSALNLVADVPNLVVVRGFSKAYGLGSLRLAYCVASRETTQRLRTAIPPLQPSSLSLRIGAAILRLGDIGEPLRARIRESKSEMNRLFAHCGIGGVIPASTGLPYHFVQYDPDLVSACFELQGILGKVHRLWPDAVGAEDSLYRLSTPLSAERMAELHRRLGTDRT